MKLKASLTLQETQILDTIKNALKSTLEKNYGEKEARNEALGCSVNRVHIGKFA